MQHEPGDGLVDHRSVAGNEFTQQNDAGVRRKAGQKGIQTFMDGKRILSCLIGQFQQR
jgi:hypothetical protein